MDYVICERQVVNEYSQLQIIMKDFPKTENELDVKYKRSQRWEFVLSIVKRIRILCP